MADNITLAVATAPKRDSKTWKNEVVTWGDFKGWCRNPDSKKEAGNYVFGRLNGQRRTKQSIEARSALTLDVDYPSTGFLTDVQLLPYEMIWHTTYSSTPEQPRYRLIIPLDREVLPREYEACARAVMDSLGLEQFDATSVQPERYMFKPAAQRADYYAWGEVEGPIAVADELIAASPQSLENLKMPVAPRWKQDPFKMAGLVGFFNQAHTDLDELIATYDLPYDKAGEGRWSYRDGHGVAGMGEVRPGLWYSHHSTDPATGEICTAFDLVRIHHFGPLDADIKDGTPVNRRPSHAAMLDKASEDPDTGLVRLTANSPEADFGAPPAPTHTPKPPTSASAPVVAPSAGDWRLGLQSNRSGATTDIPANWDLIMANDPVFKNLCYNEVTLAIEPRGDLPWRKVTKATAAWMGMDGRQLSLHLERKYNLRTPQVRIDTMVETAALARPVSPVADYLNSLTWDGVPRVETCLPGVRPTDFTRLAARKSLVAAAARALEPGIKWDHSLILFGGEGLGKSLWIERLSKGWTAELGDLKSKDTLQIVARTWIAVADEGHSLKKADSNVMKSFMTRTSDTYRAPYDVVPTEHPRRCVVWGSTNEETFLRREAGNRRFLIVECGKYDIDAVTPEYVDQVWAEAVHLFRSGERLWLDEAEAEQAAEARDVFTEENALAGQIGAYLDMPVPPNWYQMSSAARFTYRQNFLELGLDDGAETIRQDKVCALQVWYEVLNGNRKPQLVEVREINEAIRLLPDWYSVPKARRFDSNYGVQRGFNRFDDKELI